MGASDIGGDSGPGDAARSFGARLVGAFKLDASVYEEVEHDTSAFGQASGRSRARRDETSAAASYGGKKWRSSSSVTRSYLASNPSVE